MNAPRLRLFEGYNQPFDERGPTLKARTMARWCNDPSKIVAYVNNYYGGKRVTREECEAMIKARQNTRMRQVPDWPEEKKPKLTLVEPVGPFKPKFKKPPEPEAPREPQPVPDAGFDVRILIDRVAKSFGITHGELVGDCRRKVFVDARSVVVAVLRERGWSYPRIGKALNHSEHSSAIHSFSMFATYAKRNPLVAKCFDRYRPDQQRPRAL